MFGKDTWEPSEYHVYFRVLETADEYFDYYRKRHAFWKMYGLALPGRRPEEALLQERPPRDPRPRPVGLSELAGEDPPSPGPSLVKQGRAQ